MTDEDESPLTKAIRSRREQQRAKREDEEAQRRTRDAITQRVPHEWNRVKSSLIQVIARANATFQTEGEPHKFVLQGMPQPGNGTRDSSDSPQL